jgi:outer membrane protein OmpA-like peptidoglycan-associated protein
MMMLKRFCLLWALVILFTPGCGKKKAKIDNKEALKTEKVVQAENNENKDFEIPLYKEEDEKLLAQDSEDDIEDFAFVDKEADVAKAESVKVAQNDDEEDTEEAEDAVNSQYKTVFFDFDKHNIRDDQAPAVRQNAELAQGDVREGKKLTIEGHTDQIGSAAYNLALSQCRAETVKKELVSAGVPATNVKTVGLGFEKPRVWSDKQTSKKEMIKILAPNRRAEIH